ncbi:MAG: 4-hydroxy-tetrahydrodipicolinate reductase [Candidatus Lariskella arthropodorum]|uniref:4-hydroxy-tetrahydrodipicolinate reductase n=1 Tax=Candidatus Lariskella endosymbiont of Epinotia ramella TaxID=3066224 RepID=UPI0030D6139A
MKKKVGIIGVSGRFGAAIFEILEKHQDYLLGLCFSRSESDSLTLENLLTQNDYIIDCSHYSLTAQVIAEALRTPKPLIICTTGLEMIKIKSQLDILSKKTQIVIVPNTSFGAYMQRFLATQLAKALDSTYDIDILEKHHRNKLDCPSGTANSIISDVISTKKREHNLQYGIYRADDGKRGENLIGVAAQRSGNIFGEHEITFTSADESISIKHTAFSKALFAKGAIKILDWLSKSEPLPGIYGIEDIIIA